MPTNKHRKKTNKQKTPLKKRTTEHHQKLVFFFQTETHWGTAVAACGIWYRSVPLKPFSSTSQYNAFQPAGTQCPTAHHSFLTGKKLSMSNSLGHPDACHLGVSWEFNSIHILNFFRAELSLPMRMCCL